jgi:hypothetical protein
MAMFLPGDTVTLAVGPGSTRVALPHTGGNVRIVNDSAGNVWVEIGASTVVATLTDSILMLPGQTSLFRLPPRATHIAGIMADKKATGSLNITLGEGT